MLDCLIVGDSLAVGVGQARPGCQTMARTGITSGSWLAANLGATRLAAGSVVISLGVNDDASMDTPGNLRRLREAVRAGSVTWLLPGLKPEVRRAIAEVARRFGDRVVDTAGQAGADHLHPSREGYRVIASWTEQGGGVATAHAAYVAAPHGYPLLAPLRPGAVAAMPVPSLYGAWPPLAATYAAIPPRDYAFRAIPSLPRR